MKVIQTNFEGLLVLEPRTFQDKRGAFYETWRLNEYKEYGINENFVQDNISVSNKNTLRGLHYQKDQGQLVWVSYGKIFDVAVDIRPSSPTFKKYFSVELSADYVQQIYMPPGFAHGFCVLSDVAVINYKCTQNYDPTEEGGILWCDKDINISWPKLSFIINEQDKSFPTSSLLYSNAR